MAMIIIIPVLLVGLIATPLAIRLAGSLGALDHPGDLKVHAAPIPFLGGLAAFCALAVPVWFIRPIFLVPLGCALALGMADDLTDLPARTRLLAECAIGLTVALAEPGHGLGGVVWPILLTAILINAVNLLDGLDGLATGVAIMSCIGFAVLLGGDYQALAVALAAALAAVLVWNHPPARIYLGDGGSYLIGVTLAILLADAFRGGGGRSASWSAALLVAVPVADTTIAIVRRARAGRPLLQGDRGHIYDQLITRGATAKTAALWCIAAQMVLALAAIAIAQLPTRAAAIGTISLVVAIGAILINRFTAASTWEGK